MPTTARSDRWSTAVLVAARRFKALGAAAWEDLPEVPLLDVTPQALAAGEEAAE